MARSPQKNQRVRAIRGPKQKLDELLVALNAAHGYPSADGRTMTYSVVIEDDHGNGRHAMYFDDDDDGMIGSPPGLSKDDEPIRPKGGPF